MDLGLQNKNIIVTGGTRGMGRRGSLGAAEGANVSICGRTSKFDVAIMNLQNMAHKFMGQFVISPTRNIGLYRGGSDALGGIDGLVNNPSGFGNSDDEESWSRGIDIDVMGVVCCTWAATDALKASKEPL